MSYLPFKDISYAQGAYDMLQNSDEIICIKMSGGDLGCYYDSQASRNYNNAVNAGKAVAGYHFAGGTDPTLEADFFIRAMSPLAENDVLVLDWEVQHTDPVNWVLTFVNRVHDKTSVWPLVYMNMSTANSYDWSPVFNNCGYWCAAPSFGFDETLPVKYPQIAQQGGIVDGVDTNAWFGTLEQFKAYGYHSTPQVAQPTPEPAPVVETTPEPTTVPDVQPTAPVTQPDLGTPIDVVVVPKPPVATPTTETKPTGEWDYTVEQSIIDIVLAFLKKLFGIK